MADALSRGDRSTDDEVYPDTPTRRGAIKRRKIHEYMGHKFRSMFFRQPVFCSFCSQFIWGLSRRGYKCKGCGCAVHKRCHEKVLHTCPSTPVGIQQTHSLRSRTKIDVPHRFKPHTYLMPTFCDHCGSFMAGLFKQGFKCESCHINCHKRCSRLVGNLCGVNQKLLAKTLESIAQNENKSDRMVDPRGGEYSVAESVDSDIEYFSVYDTMSDILEDILEDVCEDSPAGSEEEAELKSNMSGLVEEWEAWYQNKWSADQTDETAPESRLLSGRKPTNDTAAAATAATHVDYTVAEKEVAGAVGGRPPSEETVPSPHPKREQKTSTARRRTTSRRQRATRLSTDFKRYKLEDFDLISVLGRGHFGKVFLAELIESSQYYAVKAVKKSAVMEAEDIESTITERRILVMATGHPFLIHLHSTFQTPNHIFFVMEYANGGDLIFHLIEYGAFSLERCRFYTAEIVCAIQFLHSKDIVYRDLKPDNILLDSEGHIRLGDFGICKEGIVGDVKCTTICGTLGFIAPEVYMGEPYDQAADIWGLGVLTYEMMTGNMPYSGETKGELIDVMTTRRPKYSRSMDEDAVSFIDQCLTVKPEDRLGRPSSPYGSIQQHKFFIDIDWDKLLRKEIEPPFKPDVESELDICYFDEDFTSENPNLSPPDKVHLDHIEQMLFRGFTFTNKKIAQAF